MGHHSVELDCNSGMASVGGDPRSYALGLLLPRGGVLLHQIEGIHKRSLTTELCSA